jgi:hypothetical protein
VEVYKQETRELIRRFLMRQLSLPNCVAGLDAALAGLLLKLQANQLDEVRAVMRANNHQIMAEMASRSQEALKDKDGTTFAKH